MFKRAFRLPINLAGIPLYVDLSFLLVLPLMIWVTAQNFRVIAAQFGISQPGVTPSWIPVALGAIGVVGLFVSVILHELGHSLVARRYGVKIRRITLWFLGGMAEFEEMPKQRGAEAVVAIAGPAVSFICAGVFFAMTMLLPQAVAPWLWLIGGYLMLVNFMLGTFNLIPAMPMDGGRILRSLLALKMPHVRATRISANVARVIAVVMGVAGLFYNPWLILLAFFIWSASSRETQFSEVTHALAGLGVRDVMSRDVRVVPAWAPAGEVARYMMAYRLSGFPVVDEAGRVVGSVGMEELEKAHPGLPVWQVMSGEVKTIGEDATALDAFARLAGAGENRLFVANAGGNTVGVISRSDLARAIELRMMGYPVGGGEMGGWSFAPTPPEQWPAGGGPEAQVRRPERVEVRPAHGAGPRPPFASNRVG